MALTLSEFMVNMNIPTDLEIFNKAFPVTFDLGELTESLLKATKVGYKPPAEYSEIDPTINAPLVTSDCDEEDDVKIISSFLEDRSLRTDMHARPIELSFGLDYNSIPKVFFQIRLSYSLAYVTKIF
jgi:hypothetical protein